jgi:flagellin-specific chaperone FliS
VFSQECGAAMTSAPQISKLYNRTKITTANHAQGISLLHHRCVQFIQLSLDSPSPRRKYLNAAQNILAQFERSLDTKNELAFNFFRIYDYCYCLLESNRPESHRNALAKLVTVRDAFDSLLLRKDR